MSDTDEEKGVKAADRATGRKVAVVGMLVAGLIVPALGIAVAWKSCGRSAVAGAIDVKDSKHGSWRLTVARCRSGGAAFRGVELAGPDDSSKATARVEVDPIDGPVVSVWSADGQGPLVVKKKDCADLTADVRDIDKRDDDAEPRYNGNVGGACPLPGGGTMTIEAWWRDCGE
ncbi:MAG TPA: hypothetical protein VM261_37310 [Kofleriaceae bacterium]|nr:hypothetical protein [Kofleriaceae bacterium]